VLDDGVDTSSSPSFQEHTGEQFGKALGRFSRGEGGIGTPPPPPALIEVSKQSGAEDAAVRGGSRVFNEGRN